MTGNRITNGIEFDFSTNLFNKIKITMPQVCILCILCIEGKFRNCLTPGELPYPRGKARFEIHILYDFASSAYINRGGVYYAYWEYFLA